MEYVDLLLISVFVIGISSIVPKDLSADDEADIPITLLKMVCLVLELENNRKGRPNDDKMDEAPKKNKREGK